MNVRVSMLRHPITSPSHLVSRLVCPEPEDSQLHLSHRISMGHESNILSKFNTLEISLSFFFFCINATRDAGSNQLWKSAGASVPTISIRLWVTPVTSPARNGLRVQGAGRPAYIINSPDLIPVTRPRSIARLRIIATLPTLSAHPGYLH